MSTERNLLASAIADRRAYNLIARHVPDTDYSAPGKVVWSGIVDYYGRDVAANSADLETLTALIMQSVPNPKHRETFSKIMEGLAGPVSPANVVEVVLGAKREAVGSRLARLLASGQREGVDALLQELALLNATNSLDVEVDEGEFVDSAPSLLNEDESSAELLRVRPASLNERLNGGLRRGHHMIVFARPDMGKTAFLVNLTAGFLFDGHKVLYLGNEEPIRDTIARVIGRMSEMTQFELNADIAGAETLALERGYDNFRAHHMHPGTPAEIERLVVQSRPDVVIVDQIRNVSMKEDNIVRQLEKAGNAVRQIAGRHRCVAVSATQAGDSASGKPVLDMGDVDSSNTGIPGACDVMVGIGAREEDVASNRRILSIAKNKRGPSHDFFPVGVDLTISKFINMG